MEEPVRRCGVESECLSEEDLSRGMIPFVHLDPGALHEELSVLGLKFRTALVAVRRPLELVPQVLAHPRPLQKSGVIVLLHGLDDLQFGLHVIVFALPALVLDQRERVLEVLNGPRVVLFERVPLPSLQ